MENIVKPDKEAIRDWMKHRQHTDEPLPDREQIRRQLGWSLVKEGRVEHKLGNEG